MQKEFHDDDNDDDYDEGRITFHICVIFQVPHQHTGKLYLTPPQSFTLLVAAASFQNNKENDLVPTFCSSTEWAEHMLFCLKFSTTMFCT